MSAAAKPSMSFLTPPTGKTHWVYCCGAHATEESARQEAQQIAPKFAGENSGAVFWHDTRVLDFVRDDSRELSRQAGLVNRLASSMRKCAELLHEKQQDPPLTVIGHSYGAELIRQALLQCSDGGRSHFSVVTLGGVSMIPKSLARTARNYVHVDDLIAEGANRLFDRSGVLDRVKKVYEERMRPGTNTVRQAILRVFAREVYENLNTTNLVGKEADEAAKIEKDGRYVQLFLKFSSEGIDRGWVARGLENWIKPIKDYNIYLMQEGVPVPDKPFGFDEELAADPKMCEDAIQEMIALGKKSLASHVVTAFAGISLG
ncbi:MAG TPA: hypothetical protein VLF94_08105 [Chlamydiales bacterium]|nr:hypothetical protein [Chlamydiales bacterium]